jgi:hypothetical protein
VRVREDRSYPPPFSHVLRNLYIFAQCAKVSASTFEMWGFKHGFKMLLKIAAWGGV